ncbi:FAD-dependent oxidoreductase [Anaerosalibacter bizertensis]|uniref:FAD-dependent oxidoreductase n=1 Tax=Anaerosalibacter bizertensis TaxID=932217 RepID=A0A9Q4FMJ6_9FIRM|nr:FAD-dependent oxidoreductase [Anaerosalibacter bizertensis]MCG4565809.1 FAD-dependent oxidoreductase [Anaerosalibacter bizertensis]MCG4583166.1 FAD-dependent oxidoreductase [Anaerosalibacter bizertensis]
MNIKKVDYLIIGNGIAGLSAAEQIRKNDENGSITMISNEPYFTYYRVRLTDCISKKVEDKELLVKKEEWYKEKNIEVILNKIVEKIDTDNSKIKLDDGKEIEYGKLLLATGSRPFIPPITGKYKKGVFALRTLKDLRYIQNYFSSCENVTVIGGGLLGIEAAYSVKQLDKKVNIIEHSPYLLSKQLDEEISRKLEAKLRDLGFNLYLGCSAEEILGQNIATGIKLDGDRQVSTDAVLVSSGVRPNLDLVRDTKIKCNRGIIVDKYLRTNIDNVYAAGDVAEVENAVLGLWTAGNEQGKIVGGNMTENIKEYISPTPFTTLRIGDISLFSAGNVKEFDKVYEHKGENGIHHKLFTNNDKITGVILFGDLSDMVKAKKAVLENMNVNDYLKNSVSFK